MTQQLSRLFQTCSTYLRKCQILCISEVPTVWCVIGLCSTGKPTLLCQTGGAGTSPRDSSDRYGHHPCLNDQGKGPRLHNPGPSITYMSEHVGKMRKISQDQTLWQQDREKAKPWRPDVIKRILKNTEKWVKGGQDWSNMVCLVLVRVLAWKPFHDVHFLSCIQGLIIWHHSLWSHWSLRSGATACR